MVLSLLTPYLPMRRYNAILYGQYTQAFLTSELKAHWQQGTRVGKYFVLLPAAGRVC